MIFLLLSFAISYQIRSKNAAKIFTKEKHKAIFVVLYSDWCPHCFDFKEVKEKIQTYYKGSKNVDIAQINCDREKDLCSKFKGTGTPRIYITKTTIEDSIMYESSRTFEDLKAFIEKYTQPPVLQISSKSQLQRHIKRNMDSSVFIMQDLRNTRLSKIVKKLATKYSSYPAQFFNLTFPLYGKNSSVFYQIYPQTKRVINITDTSLSNRVVTRFVKKHLYPSFSAASSHFFEVQKLNKEPFLILADWKHEFTLKLREMTVHFPEDLKSVDIDELFYLQLCKALEFSPKRSPSLLIVNPRKNTYFDYRGRMRENEIVEWVNKVWDGKIKEKGPGAGFVGFFRRNAKMLKEAAGFGIILFSLIIVGRKLTRLYTIGKIKLE